MLLPTGFQRKEWGMRTNIIIAGACCLISCGLLKKSTESKSMIETRSKEVLKMQAKVSETRAALYTQDLWSNDSSETVSMVEILPSSVLNFTAAKGFTVEANSIRIFTKHKTGKSQVRKLLISEDVNTDHKTIVASNKENKLATTQKNKVSKGPSFFVIIMIVLAGVLLIIVLRYRNS